MTSLNYLLTSRKIDFVGLFLSGLFLAFISRNSIDASFFVPTGLGMSSVGAFLFLMSMIFGEDGANG